MQPTQWYSPFIGSFFEYRIPIISLILNLISKFPLIHQTPFQSIVTNSESLLIRTLQKANNITKEVAVLSFVCSLQLNINFNQMKNPLPVQGKAKYSRVPGEQKRELLKRIFIDHMSVKEVTSSINPGGQDPVVELQYCQDYSLSLPAQAEEQPPSRCWSYLQLED